MIHDKNFISMLNKRRGHGMQGEVLIGVSLKKKRTFHKPLLISDTETHTSHTALYLNIGLSNFE